MGALAEEDLQRPSWLQYEDIETTARDTNRHSGIWDMVRGESPR